MFITNLLGTLFSEDPQLRLLQMTLVGFGAFFLFLLLFTLRDIILRTRSFVYQLFSIALVALLPGLGFLLYLLIRPARTIKEREAEAMLKSLTAVVFGDEEEEYEEVGSMYEEADEEGSQESEKSEEPQETDESDEDEENADDKPAKNAHTRRRSHS